jgi:hypothetical protein
VYVESFLICDAARVDEWGRIDVRGQYHALSAPGFPAKHDLVLLLVLEWDRGDHGRYDFTVELFKPDGASTSFAIRGGTEVATVPDDRPRARTRVVQPMEEVIFESPGEYRFRLRVKGRVFEGPRLFLMEGEPAGGDGSA